MGMPRKYFISAGSPVPKAYIQMVAITVATTPIT